MDEADLRYELAVREIAQRVGLSRDLTEASLLCNCPAESKLKWPLQRLRAEVDHMMMRLLLGGLWGLWDCCRRPQLPLMSETK